MNKPRISGIAANRQTLAPPPDCPITVTLSGSPPKLAILSCIHRMAATISNKPALPESLYFSPKADKSVNPNTPKR